MFKVTDLEDEIWAKEDVGQSQNHQSGQPGEQEAAQKQELPVTGQQSTQSEADKNDSRSQQCCGYDTGLDGHNQLHERTECHSTEESKAHQVEQALGLVLGVVGSGAQQQQQSQGTQYCQQASLKQTAIPTINVQCGTSTCN